MSDDYLFVDDDPSIASRVRHETKQQSEPAKTKQQQRSKAQERQSAEAALNHPRLSKAVRLDMDEDIEAMQSNLFSMNVARLYSHQSRAS
jgi:hypothetical protein